MIEMRYLLHLEGHRETCFLTACLQDISSPLPVHLYSDSEIKETWIQDDEQGNFKSKVLKVIILYTALKLWKAERDFVSIKEFV